MYLETRDLGDMMDIYYAAWERGVKTTYYLHMKPRHTAEQSTVRVNKSEEIGSGAKRGFGAAAPATSPAVVATPAATEPAPGEKELASPSPAPARRGFGFSGLAAKGDNE